MNRRATVRARLACAALLTCTLLAGCPAAHMGDEDAALAPDAGPPLTFEELDRAIADMRCERAIRCEAVRGALGSCHPAATRRGDGGFALRERICVGGVINASAARHCIEAAGEEACRAEGWDADLAACLDVIEPPVPAGSSCQRWSCGPDAYCGAPPTCVAAGCPWSCLPRGSDGAPCHGSAFVRTPTFDCDAQHDCTREPGVSPEPAWRCRPRTHPGDACGESACTYPQQCTDGVCVGPAELLGDDCEGVGCEGDLQCVRGADGRATCQIGAGPGEACTERVFCYHDPTCTGTPCAAGNRCVEGTCVAIAMPGDSCASSDTCPGLFHCAAGRCVPDGNLGDRCSEGSPCAEGACEAGTCVLVEPEQPCARSIGEFVDELGPCRVGTCTGDGVCPVVVPLGSLCPTGDRSGTHACDQNVECHPSTGTCELVDPRYVCI